MKPNKLTKRSNVFRSLILQWKKFCLIFKQHNDIVFTCVLEIIEKRIFDGITLIFIHIFYASCHGVNLWHCSWVTLSLLRFPFVEIQKKLHINVTIHVEMMITAKLEWSLNYFPTYIYLRCCCRELSGVFTCTPSVWKQKWTAFQ